MQGQKLQDQLDSEYGVRNSKTQLILNTESIGVVRMILNTESMTDNHCVAYSSSIVKDHSVIKSI